MEYVKLGDICTKGSSNIAQKDLLQNEGEYPIYGASGLIKYVDFYKQEKPYVAIVKDGAGVGRVMNLPAKSSVIGTMQYIFPNEEIDVGYLAYVLEFLNLGKYCSGATIPHIYFKDYSQEKIRPHTKEEQHRIAAVLDKVSILIDQRRQQLETLDTLVKSQFIEMFGDPLSGHSKWDLITFGDICRVRQGLQIAISKRLKVYEKDCYKYITVAYIHGSKECEYIKSPKATVICTKDDILMTRTGNTGMVITDVEGVFHNNFFLIDFDKNRYKKDFIVEYLNLNSVQGEIKKRAGTATIPDLNHGDFYNLPILLPPIEIQQKFVVFKQQTDKLEVAIQQSLETLETLKKSLMQQYFG